MKKDVKSKVGPKKWQANDKKILITTIQVNLVPNHSEMWRCEIQGGSQEMAVIVG